MVGKDRHELRLEHPRRIARHRREKAAVAYESRDPGRHGGGAGAHLGERVGERVDQLVDVEQAANVGLPQCLAACRRLKAEQAGYRIEAQGSARHFRSQRHGEVADRPAEHQVEVAIGK